RRGQGHRGRQARRHGGAHLRPGPQHLNPCPSAMRKREPLSLWTRRPSMLEEKFEIVYTKFKLHFYQEIFARFQNREASLTTVETFAMETMLALEDGRPS